MTRNEPVSSREWGGRLPVALVFPEEESLALSTLGWQAVYNDLGRDSRFYVERFFWDKKLQGAASADSNKTIDLFPLVCFSLNFEGDFLNLIHILKSGQIPVLARDRSDWPLIMAGGPIAFLNPFPIIPSLDFLYVGESEGRFKAVAGFLKEVWLGHGGRHKTLKALSAFPGIFVPENENKVKRQVQGSGQLEHPAHSAFISNRSIFKDSLLIEINRGCGYGCRFCAAGFIYRPPRQAGLKRIQDLVETAAPRKVGLVGTALTDWKPLKPFLAWLADRRIKFSLSSMRADGLDWEFLQFLRKTGIRSITLAVEGISCRLRSAINKHFDQEKFFQAVELVSKLRFNNLKLYFILGLPGEKPDDFQELECFLKRLDQARTQGMGSRKKGVDLISISASMFVPKPWTPMQWAPMDQEDVFLEKAGKFRQLCAPYKGLKFNFERPFMARIQGLLSRGGPDVHELLLDTAENKNDWRKGLKNWSGSIKEYLDQELPLETSFPWEVMDMGIDRSYLEKEWQKYRKSLLTRPCPESGCQTCRRCGMQILLEEHEHGQNLF
ncbi:radical SAM protein [Desulfonatronovibrio hydrogenovorans]|uniref:radical SAM protein n=1 Tax=Desulfonatronovibrio hydrogenovorans TaxID=53245 RepID=UPI00055178B6|nr:radical SAM protein [Desulfonatronovibrio hydrogenovorans]